MRPVPPAVLRLVLLAFLVVSSSAILYATVMNELSLGMRWTPRVFTETGYEFSHGDSFLEKVDSHAFAFSAGIDWTRWWFSTVNYTYRTWDGDSGSANDSSGHAGIGYRFGNPER